ncbi:hypothetical protein GO755_02835 [Spirosoma sp. HMF4905]|uniref:Galactose oxidase n=1 Tax=Spirosoma arboris TaxID=2682092 RepID=A0A7K1S589_9BACT|nr:hypothetical protein [Spirosoma arboris]MVM28954.1 hypothetical protein [Spirosoma arboris]
MIHYVLCYSWFFACLIGLSACQTTPEPAAIFTPESQAVSRASLVSVQATSTETAEVIVKSSPSLKLTDWLLTVQTANDQPVKLESGETKSLKTFSIYALKASGLVSGQTYTVKLQFLYNGRDTLRVERMYTHHSPANWRRLAHLDADAGDFTGMLIASENDPAGVATSLQLYRYVDEQSSSRVIYQTGQDNWLLFPQANVLAHRQVLFRLQDVPGVNYVFFGMGYQNDERAAQKRIYLKTFSSPANLKPDYAGEDGDVALFTTLTQAFFLTQGGSSALWIRDGNWDQHRGRDFPEATGTLATFTCNGIGYVVNEREGQPIHVFSYNPATDQWTRRADFPGLARSWGVGFSIAGKGYFGAGITGEDERGLRDLWQYDPATDKWQYITDYPGQGNRYLISYGTATKAYIGWGYESQASPSGGARVVGCTDFWEFTP